MKKIPHPTTLHGDTRIDQYHWLQDRNNEEVLQQLKHENESTKAIMADTEELQNQLNKEMIARIQETDESAPYQKGSHFYSTQTLAGLQYPIYVRRQINAPESQKEFLIDLNILGKDLDYISLGFFDVSPCENLLALSLDTNGSEVYHLKIQNIKTGEYLATHIANVVSFVWANDSETFFYTKRDASMREYQVFRHNLKTSKPDGSDDILVFEETDPIFSATIGKSKSDKFIFILATSGTSKEYQYLPADQPRSALQMIAPRAPDHEYSVDHHEDHFYILTNQSPAGKVVNFRLVKTLCAQPSSENWQEVVAHRDNVMLENLEVFKNHLVIQERSLGLNTLVVINPITLAKFSIPQPESTFAVSLGRNYIYDTALLRFDYTSLTTPLSIFDFDMNTQQKTKIKVQPVLGGYNPEEYAAERIWATAPDGVKVPVSLVYKKSRPTSTDHPLYLTGYGSYGISYDVFFSPSRLSLLDRGITFAIAHIRGGGDLGEVWRNDGKMLKKQNTFTDFIACAEHLIAQKYTTPQKLLIQGGSAGGLLMGAVTNLRPDLFKAVIADVPFVDCLNTMLDATLPLTTGEYVEWGNPEEKLYYETIKAYCPYTNVAAKPYPTILAKAGLNDPRVQYWEAAKWAAKLREFTTSQNPILLKTNMGAGHGGSSGRYDKFKEIAFDYAFVLKSIVH